MTRTHDSIAQDTAAFLANGGRVHRLAATERRYPNLLDDRHKKMLNGHLPLKATEILDMVQLNFANITCSRYSVKAIVNGGEEGLQRECPSDRLCAIVARILDSHSQPVSEAVRERAERWNAVPRFPDDLDHNSTQVQRDLRNRNRLLGNTVDRRLRGSSHA